MKNRIQEILDEQGRSQKWLADKLKNDYDMSVTYGSINRYCTNLMQPKLNTSINIAEILGVDVKDLVDNDYIE